jgi:hypothetical protein
MIQPSSSAFSPKGQYHNHRSARKPVVSPGARQLYTTGSNHLGSMEALRLAVDTPEAYTLRPQLGEMEKHKYIGAQTRCRALGITKALTKRSYE